MRKPQEVGPVYVYVYVYASSEVIRLKPCRGLHPWRKEKHKLVPWRTDAWGDEKRKWKKGPGGRKASRNNVMPVEQAGRQQRSAPANSRDDGEDK